MKGRTVHPSPRFIAASVAVALAGDRAWMKARREKLAEADARLNREFAKLLARQ